ncbi:hypothetical protein BDD12DRAFT_843700 [Trichophaea hybrida]|nr:hypothetical protein BDD12DRAFT_843700 [Trichophaea hybrida]
MNIHIPSLSARYLWTVVDISKYLRQDRYLCFCHHPSGRSMPRMALQAVAGRVGL